MKVLPMKGGNIVLPIIIYNLNYYTITPSPKIKNILKFKYNVFGLFTYLPCVRFHELIAKETKD